VASRIRRTVLVALLLAGGLLAPAPPAGAGGEPQLEHLAQIDIGDRHACARTDGGRVWCWGAGQFGRLGRGSEAPSEVPVRVLQPAANTPLVGVRDLSVGGGHACVVLTNGQVRCWGGNGAGQLGNGLTTGFSTRPVVVRAMSGPGPLTGVASVSAGANHTCAVLTNGQVRCWGMGTFGQLGTGNRNPAPRPRAVRTVAGSGPLTGVASVSAGVGHTCAVLGNGEARCWGQGGDGEIGDGTTPDFAVRPRRVLNPAGTGPLVGVRAIAAAIQHSCAVLVSGQVRCWGLDLLGALGNGPGGSSTRPIVVRAPSGTGPLTGATSIAAGDYHTCVVVTGRQVRCWGENGYGSLGNDGAPTESQLPVVVTNTIGSAPFVTATSIGASADHTCARLASGKARCWGLNGDFELGNAFPADAPRPVPVLAP
jgi:alpha-tubulin suppressor-like RCC1 family protein